MFYCADCNSVLEDENNLAKYRETGEFWGSEYVETSKVCPYCQSSEIIEVTQKCSCCGEYITGKYIKTEDGQLYCRDCYMEGDIIEEYYH